MSRARPGSRLPLFVTGLMALNAGCKARVAQDGGAQVRDEGSTTNVQTFNTVVQNMEIGNGWSSKTKSVVPNTCVAPDLNSPKNVNFEKFGPATAPKTVPADFPAVAPPAAPAQPPMGLRLEDGDGVQQTETSPDPAAAAGDANAILAKYPDKEFFDKPGNDGSFENNLKTFMNQLKVTKEMGGVSTGLFLDGEKPKAPTETAAMMKKIAEDMGCDEDAMTAWFQKIAGEPEFKDPIAVEQRIVLVNNISKAASALGIKGSVNLNLLNGISAGLSGGVTSAVNMDSNSVSLFIDVISATKLESFANSPGGEGGASNKGFKFTPAANAVAAQEGPFKALCGDQWIYSVARGSRYTTQYRISSQSMEDSLKIDAHASLNGLKIGPTSIDLSGDVDYSKVAASASSTMSSTLFSQMNGVRPAKFPTKPGCMIALAAGLPRATASGGQIVAFATASYPAQQSATDELAGSSEGVAASYLELIQLVGRMAHQMFNIYNVPYQYSFLTQTEFDAMKKTIETKYTELVGESIKNADDPQNRWKSNPMGFNSEKLMGKAIRNATAGVTEILSAKQEDRQGKVDALKVKYEADKAKFDEIRDGLNLPDENGESYFAQLIEAKGVSVKADDKTGAQAAKFCQDLNELDAYKAIRDKLQSGKHTTWGFRLPVLQEVKRIRFGAKSLLKKQGVQVGELYVNAFAPKDKKAVPPVAEHFIQVDIKDVSDDEPDVKDAPGPGVTANTICVFGPS